MFICVRWLSLPPVICQCIFEELINNPSDRRRWYLKDNAGCCAREEPGETTQPVDRSRRRCDAVDVFALLRHGTAFLRVQQRLADVEWSRKSRGDGSSKSTGKHVRHRPVLAISVNEILSEFVDDKVKTLIGNVQHKLRAETVIECVPAFLKKNCPSTVEGRPVRRSIHLHALLDHYSYTKLTLIIQHINVCNKALL